MDYGPVKGEYLQPQLMMNLLLYWHLMVFWLEYVALVLSIMNLKCLFICLHQSTAIQRNT